MASKRLSCVPRKTCGGQICAVTCGTMMLNDAAPCYILCSTNAETIHLKRLSSLLCKVQLPNVSSHALGFFLQL